jgi:methionyl-tRNA formyltransferase
VGRHGSTLQAPAVKQYALAHHLPVLQPEKMKDPAFVEQLRQWDANLQVVVAFRMLPEVVWAMPRYGTFNVHAALLPDYRGAAPINWAIINGETQTGVTTFFLDHDIDTGRIIRQKTFDIPDEADVEYVYDGLMRLGAEICLETIGDILATDGCPQALPQDEAKAVHNAPKLFKDNCEIDFSKPAKQIYDFVRGLSPVPGAWVKMADNDGKASVLKIFKTNKTGRVCSKAFAVSVEGKHLYFSTADEELEILELQLEGKKRMTAADFLNGMREKLKNLHICAPQI